MIIVDNTSKTIMELSETKIFNIKGNQDQIIAVIQKRYTFCGFISNTYINYIPCFKEIDIH